LKGDPWHGKRKLKLANGSTIVKNFKLQRINPFNMKQHVSALRRLFIVLIFICLAWFSDAQKVFSVKYENQADVKVYVVKYENQADLDVYKVKYSNQAGENDGKWFFTKYENQADKTIYFVDYENQADVKIFFVTYQNKAGWKNKEKMYFFY